MPGKLDSDRNLDLIDLVICDWRSPRLTIVRRTSVATAATGSSCATLLFTVVYSTQDISSCYFFDFRLGFQYKEAVAGHLWCETPIMVHLSPHHNFFSNLDSYTNDIPTTVHLILSFLFNAHFPTLQQCKSWPSRKSVRCNLQTQQSPASLQGPNTVLLAQKIHPGTQ